MREQILQSGKIVLITFIFSALIMILMKKIAFHIGATDIPTEKEGHRHIHKKTMPKLGGLGIFFGFLLGYMIFGEHSEQMNSILIGSFIIVITGIFDDVCELRPMQKLIGQTAAACIIAFYGKSPKF